MDERLLAGSGDVGGLFRVTCSFVNVVACLLLICLMSLAAMAMAILGELEEICAMREYEGCAWGSKRGRQHRRNSIVFVSL